MGSRLNFLSDIFRNENFQDGNLRLIRNKKKESWRLSLCFGQDLIAGKGDSVSNCV